MSGPMTFLAFVIAFWATLGGFVVLAWALWLRRVKELGRR